MKDAWVELLLTDSLDRPLGSAPYVLHRGGATEEGRLTPGGRLAFAWPEDDVAELHVCHRTIRLVAGPADGEAFDRNRLTNMGFDAGGPHGSVDPLRLRRALAAFARVAGAGRGAAARAALLDEWYEGAAGLAPVLRAAANRAASPEGAGATDRSRGRLRRWLERRRMGRVPAERSGSHLGGESHEGGRAVSMAVTTGPERSARSRNRIVVFDWFSGLGTPPRAGNAVRTLIDGEAAWGSVACDIEVAARELCISSWFADPDIELERPAALAIANPEQRSRYRLAEIVERLARRGGTTSMLLWNWVGTPLFHPTLRRWALTPDDRVEVLQHSHPSLLGSFHEKTIVIDRQVAYCGGFNLRQNDWDSQEHRVDDPRRNPHALSGWDRRTSEPRYPPRHDLTLRLEGPIVADIHENFSRHWNGALRADRRLLRRWLGNLLAWLAGAGPASRVEPMALPPARAGGVLAQFVRTDPRLRPRQQAIVDVTLRAISNARKLIYIENQFFRSPRVAAAIVEAMRRRPAIDVIVVTNEVFPPLLELNPFAYWTRDAEETIRAERPEFTLYSLVACGELAGAVAYRPVFIHAKVMVVDDEWASVGSANINDRSNKSEYEANVAVEDAAFARDLRVRLMAEHLGLAPDDPRLGDPAAAAATWRRLAAENHAARRARRLALGRAQPFHQAGGVRWLRGRPEWF